MAAGLGFKDFTTGEVLTAADVDGYLMQGIWVFDDAAARDAAVTSPQEGNCCYLKDTDAVQTYSGTAWVGFDDSNAIQNSIVDAKGDIVAASGNDTPARLAVGNDGETLVADSSTATGLAYTPTLFAGKNKIINGDFNVWQRGTSFATNVYSADRWLTESDGTAPATQETFTPGTAPVAGYEGKFFLRQARTASGTYQIITQKIEDVRAFAGQTLTVSFYAKADATVTNEPTIRQVFGSGGSTSVITTPSTQSITTSWARYSFTVSVPSISGKTIGTNSFLELRFIRIVDALAHTVDVWGVQAEAGSVATAFQTATGTIQGELAACQRYYFRTAVTAGGQRLGWGHNATTVISEMNILFPVTMRTSPTALETSGTASDYSIRSTNANFTCSVVPSFVNATVNLGAFNLTTASTMTAGNGSQARANATNSFLGWSAEL